MNEETKVGKKAFLTFFVIVILLSAVVETLICRGGPQWLYSGILFAATACMFFTAHNFRIVEDRNDKDNLGEETDYEKQ